MNRSRRRPSGASPVLVGATTLLVTVVAVVIAYEANRGLPFVRSYDLSAELPNAAKLVPGNEVRIGGFRVGVVDSVEPVARGSGDEREVVASLGLALDARVEPLPADTAVRIRPRSPLGLKFVELTPGRSRRMLRPGETLRGGPHRVPQEIDDLFETYDGPTRVNARQVFESQGDALSGRGRSLNQAVAALAPLFARLEPVMGTLSEEGTGLARLVRGLGGTARELAAATPAGARLAADGAMTLAAVNRETAALQAVMEQLPPTLRSGAASLRRTRPFLGELALLSRELRPAAAQLPRSLPPLERALRVGAPVLRRSRPLSRRLEAAVRELRALMSDPSTLLSLRDLRAALRILRPFVNYVAPYQTVCSYANYFLHPLGEHQSQEVPGGTTQQQGVKFVNLVQPNSFGTSYSARPWDLQPGEPAHGARFAGEPAGRVFLPAYQPAIDAQGNADCQIGQDGFPNWRLVEPFVPLNDRTVGTLPDGTAKGANAPVARNDYPGLAGGTYKSRELGIDSLEDVP